jgi:hypothetical protein
LRVADGFEKLFRIHENALDRAMNEFFLRDPKYFELPISIELEQEMEDSSESLGYFR